MSGLRTQRAPDDAYGGGPGERPGRSTRTNLSIRLRRAYDAPAPDDGYRVLVDRVWPRGRSRKSLRLDDWARDLGPSDELRRWFGYDPARWEEFRARYRRELASPAQSTVLADLGERARVGTLTLVYGARDEEHNQARVIAEELERRLG